MEYEASLMPGARKEAGQKTGFLKKRYPEPEETDTLKLISGLMQILSAIRSNPVEDPQVSKLVESFHYHLATLLSNTKWITLEELHNHLRVNQTLLSLTAHHNDYVQGFIFYLLKNNLRSLAFGDPIGIKEMRAFFNLLRNPDILLCEPKQIRKRFKKAGIENIVVYPQVISPPTEISDMFPPKPLEIPKETDEEPEPMFEASGEEPIEEPPETVAMEDGPADRAHPKDLQEAEFSHLTEEGISESAQDPENDYRIIEPGLEDIETIPPGGIAKDPEIPETDSFWDVEPEQIDPSDIESTLGTLESSMPEEFEEEANSYRTEGFEEKGQMEESPDIGSLPEDLESSGPLELEDEAKVQQDVRVDRDKGLGETATIEGVMFRIFVGSFQLENVTVKVKDLEVISKKTSSGTGAVFDLEPGKYDIEIVYENHSVTKCITITPSDRIIDIDLQNIQNY